MRRRDKDQTSIAPIDASVNISPARVAMADAAERPIARIERIRAELRDASNADQCGGDVGRWTNWRNA